MTEVKDRCRWVRLKYGHDERARLGEQGAIYQGKWRVGRRGVRGLCLSISWSFDLEAGKAMSRNKCLGHDILSMLGHCILAIWWQMTEQRAWSHLWSNSIDMKPRASGSEHSRKELKLNIAASLFSSFLVNDSLGRWTDCLLEVLSLLFCGFCFLPRQHQHGSLALPLALGMKALLLKVYLLSADYRRG